LSRKETNTRYQQKLAHRPAIQDAGRSVSELRRRARVLASPPSQVLPASELLHLVTFPVGQERLGLDITQVQEIQPLTKRSWSPVPCTPDFVVGVVNIRGRLYSMLDVARFLGLPARPPAEAAHVLLVGGIDPDGEEMQLGILADDVPQAVQVSLADVKPPGTGVSSRAQEYVRGITQEMLIVLNLQRLLSDPSIIVEEEA
jgi:purine-binding chemotaxis protein CheW